MNARTVSTVLLLAATVPAGRVWGLEEIAKLTASDRPETAFVFRGAAAISGDYIAVGAPFDSSLDEENGAVYVYTRDGDGWVEQVKLTASEPRFAGTFGMSVDLDGDRMVVGEPRREVAQCGFGRAYVLRREGSSWVEEARIDSPGSGHDCFGSKVAISGDRIVVGAAAAVGGAGRAYVFRREATSWILEDTLIASDAVPVDGFGAHLSIDGDRVLISAPYNDDAGEDSGSVYVFRRDGGDWVEEAKLIGSDVDEQDTFGNSVSLSGSTALVGASEKDEAARSGAAYLFLRSGTRWVQQAKLIATDGELGDRFGMSASIDRDVVVVGAPGDDDAGLDAGAAYYFKRLGSTWSLVEKLVASEASDSIGISGAVDSQLAIVGGSKAVYVFALPSGIPTLSVWGGAAMGLILLAAGTVLLRHRVSATTRACCSRITPIVVAILTILMAGADVFARSPDFSSPHHPERLLVRFKTGISSAARQGVHLALGAVERKAYRNFGGLVLVETTTSPLDQVWRQYMSNPNVLYAEPDYEIQFDGPCDTCDPIDPYCPDDTDFSELWGLHNTGQTVNGDPGTCDADINAPEAWELWTGDPSFRIAVVDSGVEYNHLDLRNSFGVIKGYDFAKGARQNK